MLQNNRYIFCTIFVFLHYMQLISYKNIDVIEMCHVIYVWLFGYEN
jgi:hypothetical protein